MTDPRTEADDRSRERSNEISEWAQALIRRAMILPTTREDEK